MADILIVDDDKMLCAMLVKRLESVGHTVTCVYTLAAGIHAVGEAACDVVFLDVQLPDGNGLDSLIHFSSVSSTPEVIIMTGAGDSSGAEKAIKSGAWSYLEKPHVIRDLLLPLARALDYRKEKHTIATVKVALKRDKIIGDGPAITACLDKLANAATAESSVLITGETGTGKEVFARALHENSPRAEKPFVIIDCASLPETLIESTLFGHARGAFTGAEKEREGLIQLANGGTLFLDEVGELPLDVQKKFLRVIQEGNYRPVGSTTELYSNFRVVAATNRDLDTMVQDGRFRADLLFRLRSFNLLLPPLRVRTEDIPVLARHFVTCLCDRLQIQQKLLTIDFIEHLQAHPWPGNVRELQQLLEEVCSRAYHHQTLFSYHLPEHIRIHQAQRKLQNRVEGDAESNIQRKALNRPLPWKEYKAMMEIEYLTHLMTYTTENIQESCEVSGISRARVYQLLNKIEYKNIYKSTPDRLNK
jgi:two-component system, NtrC family, response regulator